MTMDQKSTSRVLLVDDNEAYYDVFRRRFTAASTRDDCPHRFEVDCVGSVTLGVEKIRDGLRHGQQYHVFVFDLMTEEDPHERMAGLRGVAGLRMAYESREDLPIIIIFTAHPGYDSCVEALRHGAWDYILKEDAGDRPAAQLVVDSAIAGLCRRDLRATLRREIAVNWYPLHAAELNEQYPGQLVALWHEPSVHVVAAGADGFDLLKNLRPWRAQHAS